MNNGYLLDTHALIWATYEPHRLPRRVWDTFKEEKDTIFASAISAMEISMKFRLGKLDFAKAHAVGFDKEIAKDGYRPLALTTTHAQLAGSLPIPHKDPFDRMLIAQAQVEQLTLISCEKLFDQFGVIRLW